jgi:hypothetical protein
MFEKIAIAVVSSLVTAVVGFLVANSMGVFEKQLSDSQVQEVARALVNGENHRRVILDTMKESGEFEGPKGDQGPTGERGLPGPQGEGNKILALLIVKKGEIQTASKGVAYDAKTGVVSFSNPEKLQFIPIITDIGDGLGYITQTHFLRGDFVSTDQFKVWQTPLDTGSRNSQPDSFAAIAIGF